MAKICGRKRAQRHIYIWREIDSCEVIIWSKFGLCSSYYLVHVRENTICQTHYKNYNNRVYAIYFWQKNARANFNRYYLVQVGLFFDLQLGPDNNPYLDQIMTIKNGIIFVFFFLVLKMCWNTYFCCSVFEHQPKFAKKKQGGKDYFSNFAKHRLTQQQKTLCCNLPLDQAFVCFFERKKNCLFFLKNSCSTRNTT